MIGVTIIPVWQADAEWDDDELVLKASDYAALEAERDELLAQVEAMRDALRSIGKGVHQLQASVPMSRSAQHLAYMIRKSAEDALQAKP